MTDRNFIFFAESARTREQVNKSRGYFGTPIKYDNIILNIKLTNIINFKANHNTVAY